MSKRADALIHKFDVYPNAYVVTQVLLQGPNLGSPMVWVMVYAAIGEDKERARRRDIAQIPGATIRSYAHVVSGDEQWRMVWNTIHTRYAQLARSNRRGPGARAANAPTSPAPRVSSDSLPTRSIPTRLPYGYVPISTVVSVRCGMAGGGQPSSWNIRNTPLRRSQM